MSDDDLNDSDLEDYDVQAKAPQPLTAKFELELFTEGKSSLEEYAEKMKFYRAYSHDPDMKEKPWSNSNINKSDFF